MFGLLHSGLSPFVYIEVCKEVRGGNKDRERSRPHHFNKEQALEFVLVTIQELFA